MGEDSVLFHDLVHLILLQREALCRGHGYDDELMLTVSMDHKEDALPDLLNDLTALLSKD
jgi:hypothetical protein